MSTNYRIGHHRRRGSFHIKGVLVITLLVIGLVAGGVYFISQGQFDTEKPQSAISHVSDPANDKKTFDEKYFKMTLPNDWTLSHSQTDPNIAYVFISNKRLESNRTIYIYIDEIPRDFPVSHVLPVSAQDDRVIIGSMSGRCSEFVDSKDKNSNGAAFAKWSDVNFICGLSYKNDFIVGTSSSEAGVNKVNLKGKTVGNHTLFFVFDDQNINPDPSVFVEALRSFELK